MRPKTFEERLLLTKRTFTNNDIEGRVRQARLSHVTDEDEGEFGGISATSETPTSSSAKKQPVFWEDGDSLQIEESDLATYTFNLTRLPFKESVQLKYHPNGEDGIEWVRNRQWTIDQNIITIYNNDLEIKEGDKFTAFYPWTEEPSLTLATELIITGTKSTSVGGVSSTPPTLVDVPTTAKIGELLIIGTCSSNVWNVNDPRFKEVEVVNLYSQNLAIVSGMWMGILTDLSPVIMSSGPAMRWEYASASVKQVSAPHQVGSNWSLSKPTQLPIVPGFVHIAALSAAFRIVDGWPTIPSGWKGINTSGTGKRSVRLVYKIDTENSENPPTDVNYAGSYAAGVNIISSMRA